MSVETKAKVYNGVTIFCIVVCLLLIGRVASDELFGSGKIMVHTPPAQRQENEKDVKTEDQAGGVVLEEDFLQEQIGKYISDDFPLEDICIDISQDGRIDFTARASKSKLKDYFAKSGLAIEGGGLIFRLLPGKIDVSFSALCTCDSESGLIAAAPQEISVGDIEIDMTHVPQSFFEEVSTGVNKLILASGTSFTNIAFQDGAIVLQP